MTIPNAISLLRLLLVPVFAWLYLADRPFAALLVFAAAAISDGIDGLLARILDQCSPLGAFLDPLADKALALTALVLLVLSGTLPAWFLVLALTRDVVVLVTALGVRLSHRAIAMAPTRVSKYATFALMTTIILALIARWPLYGPSVQPFVASAGIVAAQCLLVASIQYARRGLRLFHRPVPVASPGAREEKVTTD